jgi:hypothetical protein
VQYSHYKRTMLVAVNATSAELMKIAKMLVISRMDCQVPMSSAERGSARRINWHSFQASTRISVRQCFETKNSDRNREHRR